MSREDVLMSDDEANGIVMVGLAILFTIVTIWLWLASTPSEINLTFEAWQGKVIGK